MAADAAEQIDTGDCTKCFGPIWTDADGHSWRFDESDLACNRRLRGRDHTSCAHKVVHVTVC